MKIHKRIHILLNSREGSVWHLSNIINSRVKVEEYGTVQSQIKYFMPTNRQARIRASRSRNHPPVWTKSQSCLCECTHCWVFHQDFYWTVINFLPVSFSSTCKYRFDNLSLKPVRDLIPLERKSHSLLINSMVSLLTVVGEMVSNMTFASFKTSNLFEPTETID